ncbi:hypothetical protein TNCV_3228511 [Trichonephila clavipes]|nr:hypothetical protein TNCV_3228511 [Trichonephila clavipes]
MNESGQPMPLSFPYGCLSRTIRVGVKKRWQVAWNLRVPVPETGRTSSSELIKNRAELNESDIRVNKIETKMGRTNPAGKSSGRSPLTDERIALQAAI